VAGTAGADAGGLPPTAMPLLAERRLAGVFIARSVASGGGDVTLYLHGARRRTQRTLTRLRDNPVGCMELPGSAA
jgi:hypothetical protein